MLPQSAIDKVELVLMEEIRIRSKDKLWTRDRHDIPGAYDDKGNPRFTVKLMPGLSNDLMIKCASGTIVTYFIYGTNLLGGNCKISDKEFWKVLLKNIAITFPKAFHYSNLDNGVNRILTVDGDKQKVKGQKFKFDIDEIIPLISIREVFIQSIEVKVIAKDKHTKNTVTLEYFNKLPFLRDLENEARIKLSQLRFQNDNRDLEPEPESKEIVCTAKSKESLVEFYKPSWPVIRHPLFDN